MVEKEMTVQKTECGCAHDVDSPRCPVGTEVQTLVLSKTRFDAASAHEWVTKHGFVASGMHETQTSYRFRQKHPKMFRPKSFRTIKFTEGINAVIGCPMKEMRKMKRDPSRKVFGPRETMVEVGKTYDVVTPESAEEGEFEDSGWEFEPKMMTISEALSEIRELGNFEFSVYPPQLRGRGYERQLTVYGVDSDEDYTTGAETRYALHIRGSEPAMRRLLALLKKRYK